MKSLANVGGWRGRFVASLLVGCGLAVSAAQAQFYIHLKSARYVQSSSAAPVLAPTAQFPWSENVAVMGFSQTSFSAATFTRPGGAPLNLQWQAEDEQWGLSPGPEFGTQAELDAVAPDSASPYVFSLTLTGAGSASTSALVINGGLWPNAPHVTNYDAAQAIDVSQDFTLTWNTFTGGTATDVILVFINGPQGQVFATPFPGQPGALAGTTTSVQIPAGTLVAGTAYECEVLFLKTTDQRTGDIPGANGFSAYEANTRLTIQAVTPPPPKFYILGKSVRNSQASAGAPVIDPQAPWSTIVAAIGFGETDFSAVSVTRPGLSSVPLFWSAEDGMWGTGDGQEFATEAELDAVYPNSDTAYAFNFTPGGGGAVINSPLVLNGASYPAAPHVSNYAAAQAVDPAQPFTLTWDAFTGGTASDAILVFVRGGDGPDVFSSPFPGAAGALDGTATSVQIPAGTLLTGRTYQCQVMFLKIVNQRSGDVTGATGYAAYFGETDLNLVTTGTAVGPLSTAFQFQFQHTQGSVFGTNVTVDFPVTTTYQPLFIANDDPNPPASVTITGPVGSQLVAGLPSAGFYTWGNNGRAYYTVQRTTGPNPLRYPPGGTYTVAYGGGTNYPFNVTDPDAAARQVVAVPSFTIDGAGALTAVSWVLRTPAGVATTVPASFVRASVNLNAGGNNYFWDTAPAAGTLTLDTPVTWSTVTWVSIQFEDNLRNSYYSAYQVLQPSLPTINSGPFTQTVTAAGVVTLSVNASGLPAPTYQWQLDNVDIPGATTSSYTIPNVQQFHAGAYRVVVTNSVGSVNSTSATLTVQDPPASGARLTNLSTRAVCLTGANILIPGFVVQGPGNKRLLIRAVGPTLGVAPFNIPGVLPNPRMALKRLDFSTNPPTYLDVAANDDWNTNTNVAEILSTSASLGAFALVDGSADAALLVDLAPGQYSVVSDDAGAQTGIAIVELYDADVGGGTARLINISNRGYVGAGGSIMIPGYVVSSEGPKTLLVRAVGPTLGGAPYNVPGVLADPTLTIYKHDFVLNRDDLILTNDDWSTGPGAQRTRDVAVQVSAFALADGSADAAFVITLQPGVYTVHARGKNDTEGVALVEVYAVP